MKKINNILTFRILPQPKIKNWVIGVVAYIILGSIINSQWITNPEEEQNVLIGCINQVMIPSNNGSTIIVGQTLSEFRQLRAQKIDSLGFSIWDSDNFGLAVSSIGTMQWDPILQSDQNGGVFIGYIAWEYSTPDFENRYVVVQYLDSFGIPQWGEGISFLETDSTNHYIGGLGMDGENELSVLYYNFGELYGLDTSGPTGTFIQGLDLNGNKLYSDNGILITEKQLNIFFNNKKFSGSHIIIDSSNNYLFITMPMLGELSQLYKINNQGNIIWDIICDYNWADEFSKGNLNSEDYLFILGQTFLDANSEELVVQKINPEGNILWNEGVIMDTVKNEHFTHMSINHLNGPILFSWSNENIGHVKSFDSEGNFVFEFQTISKITETFVTSDSDSSTIVIFEYWSTPDEFEGFYVQKIDALGNSVWAPSEILLSSESYFGHGNPISIPDGKNGIITSWYQESNAGYGRGVYIKKVDQFGILGGDGTVSCNLGDSNTDNEVDVLDVVLVVNIIFEIVNPTELQFCGADINCDYNIDVLDIVLIVNIILE